MKVIGMISGTSFDAVEALLVELELDGETLVCDLVEHCSVAYPSATSEAIVAVLPPATTTIEQVCRLDVAIGQFFGLVAKELIDRHGPSTLFVPRADRLSLGRCGRGQRHPAAGRTGLDSRGDRLGGRKRRA